MCSTPCLADSIQLAGCNMRIQSKDCPTFAFVSYASMNNKQQHKCNSLRLETSTLVT